MSYSINKCPPYNNQYDDLKKGKHFYFKEQIGQYLKKYGLYNSATTAWTYFDTIDCTFTKKYFTNVYCNIRSAFKRSEFDIIQQQKPKPLKKTLVQNPTQQDKDLALQQLKQVLFAVGPSKDKDTQQLKQILLSAVCHVDKNGNITNENMLRYLDNNTNDTALEQVVKNQHLFNTTHTRLLYNEQTCGDKTSRKVFDKTVDDDITKFWIDNTTLSPNTST